MAVLFFSGDILNDKNLKYRIARSRRGAAVFEDKSLQVPPPDVKSDVFQKLKKRVLPFASQKKGASLSVEAALVLPMFLLFSLALLSPIRWLDEQRKAQIEAERICEDLSLRAYEGENEREELITYAYVNTERIPFFSGIFPAVSMDVAAQRRKWIGLDGKLKSTDAGEDGKDANESYVYVGNGMGRYHRKRDCHYISNTYEAISVEEAKERRTSDRHRLNPCGRCRPDLEGGGIVYVTVEGEHYHSTTSCRAMQAYVREVPLSEVVHLGACSYCSSGK